MVSDMAKRMFGRLEEINPQDFMNSNKKVSKQWFRMFANMDDDGSGRISFTEFSGLVREELRLRISDLSLETMQRVWRALDIDGSGWISAGEFGAFMRKGEPTGGLTWREVVAAKNAASAAKVRKELEERSGKSLSSMLSETQPADPEAVTKLASLLHSKLANLFPDPTARQWFNMFRHIDDNGSGKISFYELEGMIREELKLRRSELSPETLRGVWRALDDDCSGYLTAGEFGRFMRRAQPPPGASWRERNLAASTKARTLVKDEEARQQKRQLIPTLRSEAERLEEEAERMERTLAGKRLTAGGQLAEATFTPVMTVRSAPSTFYQKNVLMTADQLFGLM